MKHTKLVAVLFFAVMIIVLAYLVASVTSCAPIASTPVQAVQPTSTLPLPPIGSVYHPYQMDASSQAPGVSWIVTTISGRQHWTLNQLHTIEPGVYIWYSNAEYRVTALNRRALTMAVVLIDCCA